MSNYDGKNPNIENNKVPENGLKTKIREILSMNQSEDLSGLIDEISNYVKVHGKDVSTSQLRNIYSKVISSKKILDAQLLRPKLMYVAARQNISKPDAKRYIEFLEKIVVEIKDDKQLESFKTFMESLVAYHKYHHPKN